MKNTIRITLAVALVVIFGVSGWFVYDSTQAETNEKDNKEEVKKETVKKELKENENLALWNEVNDKIEKELKKENDFDANFLIEHFHTLVDTAIIYLNQEGIDSEEYTTTREGIIKDNALYVRWLSEKHEFDLQFHKNLAKDANHYLGEYAKGNEDALFSLKNVIFELDLETNPDRYKPERANYISLSDAERIRNGMEPLGEYYE